MPELNDTESAFTEGATQESDPFAELFADIEEDTAFSAPTEQVPQPQEAAPTEEQPEQPQISTEEQRVRDWQAKFDKLQSEYNSYKTQSEEVNKIWSYVQNDPRLAQEVFSTVERSLSGTGSSANAAESISEPQEPAPPERPSDYNDSDAFMDPQSESFKHRMAMEQYRSDLADYKLEKRLREMEKSFSPILGAFEQEKQQLEQRAQLQKIQTTFTESGLSEEEAGVVTTWAASYEVTPEDIVTLYRLKNGAVQNLPQPAAQTAAPDKLKQRNESLNFPMPSTTAGSQREAPPKNQGDTIFDEILAFDKARNPFT